MGIIGVALVLYTLLVAENRWIGSIAIILGLGCLAFAAIANKAKSLGIHPFRGKSNDWRAAKATYKNESDVEIENRDKT